MINSEFNRPDVLVVGAGTGGCSAAIAAASAGLTVTIVEACASSDVGRKVCGNAMGLEGLEPVAHCIEAPTGAEISSHLEAGTLYLPGSVPGIEASVRGVVLNRHVFGQRLLGDALAAGARLLDRCPCVGWADRDSARVRLRPHDGEEFEASPQIVIDASGYRSVLTRSGGPSHADAIDRTEVGVSYREILTLREPLDERRAGLVSLRPEGAARGYAWVFPMGGRLANVGIGTTLATVDGSLRDAYDSFLESRPELRGAQPIDSGAGMLPLRRPLASVVGDSFMSVGDAACMASPLHGGGIVPSIQAGVAAGDEAALAVGQGDTRAEALWGYNLRIAGEMGWKHATHEVLQDLIFSLSDAELWFLSNELVKLGAAVQTVRDGSLMPSLKEAVRRLAPFGLRPRVARKVVRAALRMSAIRRHYRRYPSSPAGMDRWIRRVRSLSGR